MDKYLSYKEFLKLTESSEDRYELIDGELYLLSSPKTIHQRLLGELFYTFYNWFQNKDCTLMLAPFDITLKKSQNNINVVQPDLMVICDLDEHLDHRDYYMGTPVLVLEIISVSSRNKDLVKKLDLYMSTGVKEYWIVNPLNKEVSIYLFDEYSISNNTTLKGNDVAASYHFTGLEIELSKLFT